MANRSNAAVNQFKRYFVTSVIGACAFFASQASAQSYGQPYNQSDNQCDAADPNCRAVSTVYAQMSGGQSKAGKKSRVKRNGGDKHKSVYDSYGSTLYMRGGALIAGHTDWGDLDVLGATVSVGLRQRVHGKNRKLSVFVQPELVYFRDAYCYTVDDVHIEETFFGYGSMLSLGVAYDLSAVTLFGSVGGGPLRVETDTDDGSVVQNYGDTRVGYTGVAGLETQILDRLYFEAAYRYLGAVREDVMGLHSLEAGVNFKF